MKNLLWLNDKTEAAITLLVVASEHGNAKRETLKWLNEFDMHENIPPAIKQELKDIDKELEELLK